MNISNSFEKVIVDPLSLCFKYPTYVLFFIIQSSPISQDVTQQW